MKQAIKQVNDDFVEEMTKWELPYRSLALEFAIRLKKAAIKLGFTKNQAHIIAFQTTLGTLKLLQRRR